MRQLITMLIHVDQLSGDQLSGDQLSGDQLSRYLCNICIWGGGGGV